jgi:hypothetical protein
MQQYQFNQLAQKGGLRQKASNPPYISFTH